MATHHIVVPPGQELAVAEALAGPIIRLEPTCPMCAHVGAVRVEEHCERDDRHDTPCYLVWSGAHGVTAAARSYDQMPPAEHVRMEGGGTTSAWEILGVRCNACDYLSAPSAFCRPTGPAYVETS